MAVIEGFINAEFVCVFAPKVTNLTKKFLEIDQSVIFLQILCKIVPQLLIALGQGFQRKSVYYLMNIFMGESSNFLKS